MKAELPIAVIGAGVVGRAHIQRVLGTPGLRLAGVADTGAAGREWCAGRGIPAFASHHDLLDAARPQAAIVATPNATHLQVARDCLGRGVAVLVEKPVTDTVAAARELVEVQRGTGVPVLVGHHRRHNPVVQRARQLVQDGCLGRIVNATVQCNFHKPAGYFDVEWRRTKGGGPVLINLIHDIDMLLFLGGPARAAQAFASNAARGFEVEDAAAALLELRSGAVVAFTCSDAVASPWNWDLCAGEQPQYPRQPVQTHFICGTLGSLSLPDLSLWRYRGEPHWHRELTREQSAVHAADPFAVQLAHFRQVVEGAADPLCSAWDGLVALEAAWAVSEAARTGRRVECPSARDMPPAPPPVPAT